MLTVCYVIRKSIYYYLFSKGAIAVKAKVSYCKYNLVTFKDIKRKVDNNQETQ